MTNPAAVPERPYLSLSDTPTRPRDTGPYAVLGNRGVATRSRPSGIWHDERYDEFNGRPPSVIAISSGSSSENAPPTCRTRAGRRGRGQE
jgi:hypothetical protein